MYGTSRTHTGNEKCIYSFGWKTSGEEVACEIYLLMIEKYWNGSSRIWYEGAG